MAEAGILTTGVTVTTTSNGGHPPEFWAARAKERILHVSENAHPAIREQAIAFQNQIEAVILHFMKKAIESDRTTLSYQLTGNGDAASEVAKIIRSI